MKKNNKLFLIICGPLIFILCLLLLPAEVFQTNETRYAVGTVMWMAFWWVTGPVDYAVTAFLPIAVNALFKMCEMSDVISNYSSETILLLIGASILVVSWEETGLDKRIASGLLRAVGDNARKQFIFWFLLSAVLSSILPNAVVCATITPIAISMLKHVGIEDVSSSKIGSKLLLIIVYATGVGGLASPLGGAMNLVTIEYIQQITGEEYTYESWVIRFLPVVLVLIISNLIFLLRDVDKNEHIVGSTNYFVSEYDKFEKMNVDEKISMCLFLTATVLSFIRPLYQNLLPGLKPAYVFIICAILSFFIKKENGNRLMVWKSVQTKIIWELIYVFAGGLAAGAIINKSGAAESIGRLVSMSNIKGGVLLVLLIITITILLSDVTSNTATAAVSIPIVISVTQGIGLNPIPYIYIASVGVNLSYILPTSIRAIPVGYGLKPSVMFKEGIKLTVIVIILTTAVCALLMKYWGAFSTV